MLKYVLIETQLAEYNFIRRLKLSVSFTFSLIFLLFIMSIDFRSQENSKDKKKILLKNLYKIRLGSIPVAIGLQWMNEMKNIQYHVYLATLERC